MKTESTAFRAHAWPFAVYGVLSVAWLGSRPLDLGEAIVLTRADLPISDLLLTPYSPLYLILLNLWNQISDNPLWLRSLGILIGFVALSISPRVLRALGGTHAEKGATWLLATSPLLINQVRTVSPAQLAFLAILLAYLCFFEYIRAGRWPWLAGWLAAVVVALLIHGGLYCVVVVQCLTMLLYRNRRAARQRSWWLVQVIPLALFAMLFGAQFNRFIAHRLADLNQLSAVSDQWGRLVTALPQPWSVIGGVVLLILLLSGLRNCGDWRRDSRHGLLIGGLALPAVIWLVWLPYDFYALASLPCLVTIGSMGIRLFPRWGRQALWTLVAIIYGWSHWQTLS